MDNEEVIASVAGTIERVNKLVTVRATRTRYGGFPSFNASCIRFVQIPSRSWRSCSGPNNGGVCIFNVNDKKTLRLTSFMPGTTTSVES